MGEHWKEILDISIHKHDKNRFIKQIKLINIIGICNSVNTVFPIPYGVYIVYMHPPPLFFLFLNLLYLYIYSPWTEVFVTFDFLLYYHIKPH